jgi:GT2 family glycosyltransferase
MHFSLESARYRLRGILRRLYRRWRGMALTLQPIDQLRPVAGEAGHWQADGNDPKFSCIADGFPLKAGWYHFSIELEDPLGDRLEPMLYFDYGHGMHESWSQHLRFIQPTARRHDGVVLLVSDVHALRFDPASTPCTFRMGRFTLKRLGRMGASWRMLRAVSRKRAVGGGGGYPLLIEAWRNLTKPGGRHAFAAWLHGLYVQQEIGMTTYDRWLQLYESSAPALRPGAGLLISVVLPTYNTPEVWLRHCLDSVLAQSYPHWELCVADDASTEPQVRAVLEEYIARDPRIRVTWRERNGHISAASNSALALARGDYVALLDHDDELHPAAVATVVDALRDHPQWQFVYSDEDKIDAAGHRYDPYFKPDWNPDLLYGQNCVSHLGVYARALLNAVGGFRSGLEGSQDWDLALRCSEQLAPGQIGHIPSVLYHWRAIAGSTAQGVDQKGYAHEAGRRALQEHFARRGEAATVMDIDGMPGAFRVRHPLPEIPPHVSIIVPTRDRLDLLRRCVDSILQRSTYPNYEVVIVDNQSVEQETLAYLASFDADSRVRVRHHDEPFNYSRINNAAVEACPEGLICLLNNDIEVITPDWLEELVSHALRPHVGAVGAMLYYPNDTIQHAGVVIGVHGVAGHPYSGMPRGHTGQMARTRLTQTMSAVTAACLMVRREVFRQVGGLDTSLQVAFNDIDFCLRLRQAGYANVWTPFAELYHHESASRGQDTTPQKRARFAQEVALMRQRWGAQLEYDPAYNPNLTLAGEPFTLAFPPREWRHAANAETFDGDASPRLSVR